MSQLNPKQKEAVHYIDGPCLVLAGAGSGKTSVITRKISYLINDCGYRAHHIAALTFTNKAAREMKERVKQLVKPVNAKGLTVATFHNLGLTILKHNLPFFGLRSGFSIFDGEDSRSLLKELMLKSGDLDSDQLNLFQQQISRWKNELQSPEEAMDQAESTGEQFVALLYQHYQQALKAYNAVDFDDLIFKPVNALTKNKSLLDHWQQKLRYLLVDEYQDTNTSQYRLIRLLTSERGALTVVGDDDQSIYAWRGARPENLSILQQDYTNLNVIKLEQNYRSTQRILKTANHLIAHNPHEFTKELWSDKSFGEPIRIIRCSNEEAEAERVATEIVTQRLQRQCRYRDFAVLYRSNHQARLIEMKLQHYQIPYAISGGTSFFSRTEIKDIMAYMRLIVNPDDDNAFLRIINTPRRQIGTSTIEVISEYAHERDISLFTAIQELGLHQRLPANSVKRLDQFQGWFNNIIRQCENDDPMPILNEMIEDMDYLGWLHQHASSPQVADKRMENIHYLLSSIQEMMRRAREEQNTEEPDNNILQDTIAKLILMDLLEQQEEEDDSDRVQLMTLHAAKGLEYPHVFMIGVEEDILPHSTSIEEDNIEEERRLAYVGITRAQRSLTLTLAAKRKQFGETIETSTSRFIEELPQKELEYVGFGQSDPAVNSMKGEEALGSLLGMFD